MKFKFSIIIFLSILLCMHACTARHLPLPHHKGFGKLHFSAKMIKVSFEFRPEEEINGREINSMALEQSYEKAKINSHMELMRETKLEYKGENSGANAINKSLPVSPTNYSNNNWQGQAAENPEFYSDYSLPRTRTPSHN